MVDQIEKAEVAEEKRSAGYHLAGHVSKTKLYQIIKSKIDSQGIIEAYEQSTILQISFHSVHC